MLEREMFGNSVWAYLVALGTFLAVLAGFFALRRVVVARLRALAARTATDLDDLVVDLLEMVRLPEIVLVALWAATRPLDLPGRGESLFHALLLVALSYRAVTLLRVGADYAIRKLLSAQGRGAEADKGTARNLGYLISGLLWVVAALFVLSNLGFNVSSMIAGLGIGGVAVALAAQAILGDLFSALAIYLDRPFVVGDFIVVGDKQGTVEHIGIKTTRVRALSGEMLIVANSKLTSSEIQNFRLLRERRIAFAVRVPYGTPPEQVAKVPALIKAAVAAAPKARFDRAHLSGFGEAGFAFEAVYYVTDPDYGTYMDVNQAIHLGILDAFRKEKIAFSIPARVVHQAPSAGAAAIW
ncbi:MAG: mechanosensitive ion channel family protein [Elusimicrobia bacterium]|nr:mechanosensitive ion channel family protein [Elusimicrobiota bacterium]